MPTEYAAAIWDGIVQTGFAAFAILLLGFAFWLVLQIIKMAKSTQQVVESNTAAITRQTQMLQAVLDDTQDARDTLNLLRASIESHDALRRTPNNNK